MTTEFVPVAIGWYGEFGPSVQGFMERVGSYFGDRSGSEKEMQFAAKWRTRRLLLPAFVVTCVFCYLCLLLPACCCYLRVVVTCVFCYLFRCYLRLLLPAFVVTCDRLESRLHSSFCFIFLFQGSRFLLGVFRGSCMSHD